MHICRRDLGRPFMGVFLLPFDYAPQGLKNKCNRVNILATSKTVKIKIDRT